VTDDQPITENERRARMFEDMARQIRLNADTKFGGAYLLIPPESTVEQCHSMLLLNMEQPGIFWASIETIAKIAVNETDRMQRQQGFGR
jgi:hypothetical protein